MVTQNDQEKVKGATVLQQAAFIAVGFGRLLPSSIASAGRNFPPDSDSNFQQLCAAIGTRFGSLPFACDYGSQNGRPNGRVTCEPLCTGCPKSGPAKMAAAILVNSAWEVIRNDDIFTTYSSVLQRSIILPHDIYVYFHFRDHLYLYFCIASFSWSGTLPSNCATFWPFLNKTKVGMTLTW